MTETNHKTRNARAVVWFCVAGIVLALIGFAFLSLEIGNRREINEQAKFDPCVSLSEAVAKNQRHRVPHLTRECKAFLSALGPLVTIKLSCAIIEKARYVCPAPGSRPTVDRSGSSGAVLGPTLPSSFSQPSESGPQDSPQDASQPSEPGASPHPSQPKSPSGGSHGAGNGGSGGGAEPAPAPTPALDGPGNSENAPGHTGETPQGQGKGVLEVPPIHAEVGVEVGSKGVRGDVGACVAVCTGD